MAKGNWRELLPCKECYRIVKNQDTLNLSDRVLIEVYTEKKEDIGDDTSPFYSFPLTIESIKRPGAQRHRKIHSLLAEPSLNRCREILEQNCKNNHRSIWLSSHEEDFIKEISDHNLDINEPDEIISDLSLWKKKKKKEFKHFYNNVKLKPVYHEKDCHVDFYLSNEDKSGLIAKIKRREKLRFYISKVTGINYLGDFGEAYSDDGKVKDILIKYFIVSIYSKDKLALRLKGDVRIEETNPLLYLDDLWEKGTEIPSSRVWG